jgi:hypothetical protein
MKLNVVNGYDRKNTNISLYTYSAQNDKNIKHAMQKHHLCSLSHALFCALIYTKIYYGCLFEKLILLHAEIAELLEFHCAIPVNFQLNYSFLISISMCTQTKVRLRSAFHLRP